VGEACESAAARRVARQFGLSTSTVLAIDLRYLERWSQSRKKPALRNMGADEIHLGKKQKFITVVSNLDAGEPSWFGQDRKKDTLDEFFEKRLSPFQRSAVQTACVDMWDPFRQSIEQWLPKCRIIYDKFHIMQHANVAVDQVRRAEFFRKGGAASTSICWAVMPFRYRKRSSVGNCVPSAARLKRSKSFPDSLSEFSVPLLPECLLWLSAGFPRAVL
jgi:transposase